MRIGFGALVVAGVFAFSAQAATDAPLATPQGVTLQSVRLGSMPNGGGMDRQVQRNVYADAKGMTLYTFDKDETPGKSSCVGECAKAWPPVAASADAKTFGAWSTITRDDGSKQWAYAGKPLYTFAKDTKVGDATGNGAAEGTWHIAGYEPSEGVLMPAGVTVQEMLNAGGEIFVGDNGSPLYTFDGDAKSAAPLCVGEACVEWRPYAAAQLAKPVGDFSVVRRDDGVVQWAYKGKPLFTFDGDVVPGDVKGDGAAGKWHVAMLVRQFIPAGLTLWHNRYGGVSLATAEGMTLYERDRVVGVNTGHNLRTGMRGTPMVGRLLGTSSCDAACTKTWRPVAAPADAQASGYWEVVVRDDGSKQWAYRGFPLYTFTGDTKPGDMRGNDTYEILHENDPFKVADIGLKAAGAMVWHAVAP